MKTLFLVRHAKSSHAINGQRDIERSLSERGMEDANKMAKRLFSKNFSFDALISSPAIRAFTTCNIFAKVFNLQPANIIIENKLYEAGSETFYEVVKNTDDHFSGIALFSHNPGISYFAQSLTDKKIDGMPTCGVFGVEADIDSWKDFEQADKTFCYFDFPKNQ
ncbi:MAG: histidine phosphatase family protein [Bacteroidota bacterium]